MELRECLEREQALPDERHQGSPSLRFPFFNTTLGIIDPFFIHETKEMMSSANLVKRRVFLESLLDTSVSPGGDNPWATASPKVSSQMDNRDCSVRETKSGRKLLMGASRLTPSSRILFIRFL